MGEIARLWRAIFREHSLVTRCGAGMRYIAACSLLNTRCARRGSGLVRGRLALVYKLIELSTPRCGDVRVALKGISPAI
jgi:hypothetical protein